MEANWIEIAVSLLTAGLFSLIGFVWRFSHKVTRMEKEQENTTRRVTKMERDHDKVMDRMYSMAKQRGEFLTRQNNEG